MAQTGFTPIQLYSSSTTGNTPAAGNLLNSSAGSELAINIFDGKLFYKDNAGAVQVIGWKVVPVSAGGTGQTSYTDGQLLIGNSTGNTLTKATLTAGTGISITNGAGAITINATGGTGTVTSVSGTSPIAVATGTTTPVISISQATTSTNGYLSSTDWNTFNSKGSGTVTSVGGTGTVNGLTLTGTVTTTGNLTLGGTLDLSAPPTIGNTTANTITGTTITASTKFAGTYYDASSSAGGNLRTSGGTACFQWGAGGGNNCTVDGSINMNGANAHIDMSPTGTGHVSINPTGVGDINNVIIGATTPLAITGTTITATTFSGSGASLTSIPNSALVNSTISGVALGGSLFNLTAGTGVSFSTGTTYNGSTAITINATGTGGTVTSVAALTLGTSGTDLSSTVANGTTTPVITLNVPTASASNRGALSAADWTTFNNKGSGSVTSVAASVPSFLSISGSPITTSGTLAITLSGTALPTTSGGTGLTSFTANGIVYASSTSALATGSALTFDGTKLGVGVASPTYVVDVSQSLNGDAGPRITNSNAGAATIANFTATNGTSFSWFGHAGTAYGGYAQIRANGSGIYANGAGGIGLSADNAAGVITFGTGSSATEKMRIDASGNVAVGSTAAGYDGTNNGIWLRGGIKVLQASRNNDPSANFARTGTDGAVVTFDKGASTVGSISITASATAYNTSSDYRLKENIAPMTGALATIAKLKPVTYNWKIDGSDGQGFIAHELAEVIPDAVSGEKDAVDAEGKPHYQGIDTSFLVATLTAAIQELKAEIDILKGLK
jgi:hypothetical protein